MSYQPNKESLDTRPLPQWFPDAKLGIFIHWGLYSVPAFAESQDGDYASFMEDLSSGEDTRGRIPYAEWYLNALRTPGSPTAQHHAATYGEDFDYYDFRREFDKNAAKVDFGDWAGFFAEAGAQYVVMVSRHLDGYPLWPSAVRNPNKPADFHSPRDLVGDLTAAVRERGLEMGLYYAGGIDWTFTDEPIRTMTDLLDQSSLGEQYAEYAAAQWRELIDRYQPSVLWNDMGWPEETNPHEIMVEYYDKIPDGVVNDRWSQVKLPDEGVGRDIYLGVLGFALRLMNKIGKEIPVQTPKVHHDFRTFEYDMPKQDPEVAWELTRGLGDSFGFNAAETEADMLSGAELVRLFADVVGRGGNLLINIGPDGHGRIPDIQQRPLRELGAWIKVNGDAIYASRPYATTGKETADGKQVRYTQRDGTVYAIVLADELSGSVVLKDVTLPGGSRATVLGSNTGVTWNALDADVELQLPPLSGQPAYVVAFTSP